MSLFKCAKDPYRPWHIRYIEPDGQICQILCDTMTTVEDAVELYLGGFLMAVVENGNLLELKVHEMR